jgi:hypothetical protein
METHLTARRIEQLEDALRAYGYAVEMKPIAGQEEAFAEALAGGWAKVEATFESNAARHGTRGKSARAMANLHRDLPCPVWGVCLWAA